MGLKCGDDAVVFGVGTHKTDEEDSPVVVRGDNQPVVMNAPATGEEVLRALSGR